MLGSSYNDTIIGNANDNTLIGAGGDDLIAGLGGNDVLEGAVTRTVYLDFDTYELPGQHVYSQAERDAIQAQITADYSAFSYVFTQTQPQSGPYTTITFNDPSWSGWREASSTGSTGAISTSRARRPSTRTAFRSFPPTRHRSMSMTSWAVPASPPPRAPTSSACRPPSPPTSSAISRALSTATRYGPIGSGIYSGVNPDLYNPPYPGRDATPTKRSITSWPRARR